MRSGREIYSQIEVLAGRLAGHASAAATGDDEGIAFTRALVADMYELSQALTMRIGESEVRRRLAGLADEAQRAAAEDRGHWLMDIQRTQRLYRWLLGEPNAPWGVV